MAESISKEDGIEEKDDYVHIVTPTDSDPDPNTGNSKDSKPEESSLAIEKLSATSPNTEDNSNNESIQDSNKGSITTSSGQDSSESKSFDKITNESPQSSPTRSQTVEASLSSLGLNKDQVKFMINLDQGSKFLEKPLILSKKLKISKELASKAIEILKSPKKVKEKALTRKICGKIKACLEENPDVDSYEDIALLCEVDEEIVWKYFEMSPLTEKQKNIILERFNMGLTVSEISHHLHITAKKVEEHIALTFITFSCVIGSRAFDIITKYCDCIEISKFEMRKKILSKNLKLQDKLYCGLRQENESDYSIVNHYLSGYKESEDFLKVDTNLTMEDIMAIKRSSKNSVEELSVK